MDAVEFLKERDRMCRTNYDRELECKYCQAFNPGAEKHKCKVLKNKSIYQATENDYINAVFLVEQWSKEHPLKTRRADLYSKFPILKERFGKDGTPDICCQRLGYTDRCPEHFTCGDCWNMPIKIEV